MKHALIFLLVLGSITSGYAQYNKDKLTDILTGGSSKSWTAKAVGADRPEKGFTFNKDMSVQVQKSEKGAATSANDKWSLATKDNIRWTIQIGSQMYEIIVSYDKSGTQYVKLTYRAEAGKPTSGYELTLYATK